MRPDKIHVMMSSLLHATVCNNLCAVPIYLFQISDFQHNYLFKTMIYSRYTAPTKWCQAIRLCTKLQQAYIRNIIPDRIPRGKHGTALIVVVPSTHILWKKGSLVTRFTICLGWLRCDVIPRDAGIFPRTKNCGPQQQLNMK